MKPSEARKLFEATGIPESAWALTYGMMAKPLLLAQIFVATGHVERFKRWIEHGGAIRASGLPSTLTNYSLHENAYLPGHMGAVKVSDGRAFPFKWGGEPAEIGATNPSGLMVGE